MRSAFLFVALCGLLLTPSLIVQDPPGGPPVALAVKIESQPNPNYVAGKLAYLEIQAVGRSGMPSPINGDAVVVKTTDPRNRLNGLEVGFVNGKIVLKLQWFTPSKGHTIEVASKSGLRGSLSGIRVDPLPQGTKLSIEDPKPWARYVWSGGMFRLRVKASDENDDPVEHVEVSLKLSKGARVFPHGYYTEDGTGIASGVIFPPEFICPDGSGNGGTVNGDAPLQLQAFIDVNGNGDIDDGEPIVEPPPPDLVSSCPQVLLPAALELLRILEEGGTLEPPPEDDVIVVGVASAGSGGGKGKSLGKNKPETLRDRERAKIRAARQFLKEEVIDFVNDGRWKGQFSQVRKRVEHLAKFLKDVAPAEPVVHRLECAAKLMEAAPDVTLQKLDVQERPGGRIEVLVGSKSQFEVQNLTGGNRLASPDKFPDCFKPGVVQATTQGNGSATVPDTDQPFVEFECLGPGNVQLSTTTEFKPLSLVVLPPPDNGVVAASKVIGAPQENDVLTLAFRLVTGFRILQSPGITNVDWIQVSSAITPNPNPGGGVRIFPDRGENEAEAGDRSQEAKLKTLRRQIKLRVTIAPPTPGVAVAIRVYDVDDPSANLAPLDPDPQPFGGLSDQLDNNDKTVILKKAPTILKTNAAGQADFVFEVGMQPGDNYRAVASLDPADLTGNAIRAAHGIAAADLFFGIARVPASDEPGRPAVMPRLASPLLTVWRRVHVEVDSMGRIPASGPEANSLVTTVSSFLGRVVVIRDDLLDGSTTPPGRLENGFILLPGTIVGQRNLTGNGKDRVFITATDPVVDLQAEITAGGLATIQGTVTAYAQPAGGNNTTYTFNPNPGQPPVTSAYVGGRIRIPSGPSETIQSIGAFGPPFFITATANGKLSVELKDDDGFAMPVDVTSAAVLAPFLTEMNRVYNDAYIEILFDGGDLASNNKIVDFFDLNLGIPELADTLKVAGALESARARRDDYWIMYLMFAFQSMAAPTDIGGGDIRSDGDPDADATLGGTGDKLPATASWLFMEELRENDRTFAPAPPAVPGPHVTVRAFSHETGHHWGLQNSDTGIMSSDLFDASLDPRFRNVELLQIRTSVKGPTFGDGRSK